MMQHINDNTKHAIDIASGVTVIGTLTTWLPPIAALLSIVWSILRLIEMVTGKTIYELRKKKKDGTDSDS